MRSGLLSPICFFSLTRWGIIVLKRIARTNLLLRSDDSLIGEIMVLAGKSPETKDILREVGLEKFLKTSEEQSSILKAMGQALEAMEKSPSDYRGHLEKVQAFLKVLWTKYDCEDIIDILDALMVVEPPLLDFERRPSKAYRDHYVHIFNVYILGLRILASIIERLGDTEASKLLKVGDEKVHSVIPEFHDYSWKERLFYLWTLIANFHDISIPITRLGSVHAGLKSFLEKFGLELSGPTLLSYHPPDLEEYFEHLGRVFEGKMQSERDWCYKTDSPNFYVQGVLRREFAKQNHGVLSGFLMYEKIREIFLEGRTKRSLSLGSFNRYTDLVLKQDIARAALAISLHDLKPSDKTGYPKIFPLDFFDYPLTCLLILVDGLQEYLRWEGTSIRGGTKLLLFPELAIDNAGGKLHFSIAFFVTDEPDAQGYLISQSQALALKEGRTPRGGTLGEASQDLCDSLAKDLGSRLSRNPAFDIALSFWDKGRQLFSRQVHM